MSETSHHLNIGYSFICVPSVRDVALSKHRSLIYIVLSVRDVALSKHRSLIFIRLKCQRSNII